VTGLPDHVRRMWDEDRASRSLGMRLESVAPGRAVVSMPVRADHCNGHGIGHGGLTFTLADSAFAFACNSHGPVTVAAGAEVRFRSPVHEGEVLVARAVERSRDASGRGVYDVEVRAGDPPDDRVVATFVGRSAPLPGGPAR